MKLINHQDVVDLVRLQTQRLKTLDGGAIVPVAVVLILVLAGIYISLVPNSITVSDHQARLRLSSC